VEGSHALPISGAQDRTASQPIILIRADGAATLLLPEQGLAGLGSKLSPRLRPDSANSAVSSPCLGK